MDRKRSCKRLSKICSDGRTQQHFGPICDVNAIVEKARRTGLVSHVNGKKPIFADVSSVPDFQAALTIVNAARDSFASQPAKVRDRFNNDPGRMVNFLSDPANLDEAVKLGLMVKRPAAPPPAVPVPPAAPVAPANPPPK